MRVLLTGAAGFIGGHVQRMLTEYGVTVVAQDMALNGDLRDPGVIQRAVDKASPDAILHLAALVSVPESFIHPIQYNETNATVTARLAAFLRESYPRRRTRLVYASTAADERSPYGVSKRAGEHYVRSLLPERSVVLRLYNVYGPGARSGVVFNFYRAWQRNETGVIQGDGSQFRDFVHVSDAARAFVMALLAEPGTYDVGTGAPESIRSLFRYVFKHDSPKIVEARANDIDYSCARGAEFLPGWRARISLEEGIEDLLRADILANSGRVNERTVSQ